MRQTKQMWLRRCWSGAFDCGRPFGRRAATSDRVCPLFRCPTSVERMELDTVIGTLAAICTTASYVPQLTKCWRTGSASDLSLRMFAILATGKALWIVYGILKLDWLIVASNSVSLTLLLGILFFKLREPGKLPKEAGSPDHANDVVRPRSDRTASGGAGSILDAAGR